MLAEVTAALVALVESRTPYGAWVQACSLSAADPDPPADRLLVSLLAVETLGRERQSAPLRDGTGTRPRVAADPVRLHYLLTYTGPSYDETLRRTEAVRRVLAETPVLDGAMLPPQVLRAVVHAEEPGPEVRRQIWAGLGRPARLALYYAVDALPGDDEGSPVPVLTRAVGVEG